jgi:hypothetical protein
MEWPASPSTGDPSWELGPSFTAATGAICSLSILMLQRPFDGRLALFRAAIN